MDTCRRPLKEITKKIGGGATPRGGKDSYKSDGISLIRSMNVEDFWFDRTDLARIDEVQAGKLDNVIVQTDDVLLNITGASVARCCMVPSDVLPARVVEETKMRRAGYSAWICLSRRMDEFTSPTETACNQMAP